MRSNENEKLEFIEKNDFRVRYLNKLKKETGDVFDWDVELDNRLFVLNFKNFDMPVYIRETARTECFYYSRTQGPQVFQTLPLFVKHYYESLDARSLEHAK
jgi:hypothetical protein